MRGIETCVRCGTSVPIDALKFMRAEVLSDGLVCADCVTSAERQALDDRDRRDNAVWSLDLETAPALAGTSRDVGAVGGGHSLDPRAVLREARAAVEALLAKYGPIAAMLRGTQDGEGINQVVGQLEDIRRQLSTD
ncbi:hypothetical protein [Pseudonocardia sp. NPDC049154]|uniref:hypothetical protein n=1 Tax=Pseudonocardia sp. NPDC049154 TaxID=3155501 RepID=UPI0033CB8F9B